LIQLTRRVALAALLFVPVVAFAQTGEALLKKIGTGNRIENPTFPGNRKLEYKVAWDVTEGAAKPEDPTAGFSVPANFLMMADENGLDRKKVHLAIIVHGTATQSLLSNEAYKAVLEALNGAGVQVIVCGQALISRKVPRDKLLPFVKVATSATMARATLHAMGYATFTP
jgi:intracellular sulfur oxidation DsrE/DsrF family protein